MQMGSSRSRMLIPISFFFFFLIKLSSAFWPNCETDNSTFTANSTYGTNLDNIFSQLSSISDFNYGFHNFSIGQSPDQVHAIALCRGDQKQDKCKSCFNDTILGLKEKCPNKKVAIGWSEYCTVRYSSLEIYKVMASKPGAKLVYGDKYASDVEKFYSVLKSSVYNLTSQAAAGGSLRKYAAGSVAGLNASQTIYTLVQCTPDLSGEDCSDCIIKALESIKGSVCDAGMVSCTILRPSCNLQYDINPFYDSVDESSPGTLSQPPSPPPQTPVNQTAVKEKGGNKTPTIIISKDVHVPNNIVITMTVSIVSLVLSIWICLKLKKPKNDIEVAADEMIKAESLQYDFATIQVATNNFCDENKLGQGGFGEVYKGKLANGQEVAVKRLSSGSRQGDVEFKNELLLVAKLQHRNLVRLLGFCLEGDERLLIYEYVRNASLDHFIFDPIKRSELNWERRYKIIGGIARGLLYLHEDSLLRIIHRDLKASNILLDEDLNSKIADFGIAKLFFSDETHGNTNRVMGTYGYMAPEYAMHGRFSIKSDVFSFGVLILEIVSGKKNGSSWREDNDEEPLQYAWKQWKEGTGLGLIDPSLRSNGSSTTEMMKCFHIGLLCVQDNVADRPTMACIVHMLSGNSTVLPMPSEPIYTRQSYNAFELESSKLKNESLPVATNDITITALFPR